MKRMVFGSLIAALGMGALANTLPVRADQVVLADLMPTSGGGPHAMTPQKVKFTATRPSNVTKEPPYRYTPMYGVVMLGDAKNNQIVVVLDSTDGATRPRLYVDSNGNGDLTDEPPVALAPMPVPQEQGSVGSTSDSGNLSKGSGRLGATVAVIAHYNVAGRGGEVESTLLFTLWDGDLTYNREYSRLGKVVAGGHTYRIALVDQNVDGLFNEYRHDGDAPTRVTVLIDRNGDGKFDPRREAYDAAKPIRLPDGMYQITAIDPRGTRIYFQQTKRRNASSIAAADLRVGSDVIDFDVDTTDGKTVSFPDDYKGKIVLLDFWATWCPPCREVVPDGVQVYNKFSGKGYEVLGISLDQPNEEKTLAAFIRQFGMTWPQVYDGGYWKAEIAKLYAIDSIPHAILVNGDTGKILAILNGSEEIRSGLEPAVAQAVTMLHTSAGKRDR